MQSAQGIQESGLPVNALLAHAKIWHAFKTARQRVQNINSRVHIQPGKRKISGGKLFHQYAHLAGVSISCRKIDFINKTADSTGIKRLALGVRRTRLKSRVLSVILVQGVSLAHLSGFLPDSHFQNRSCHRPGLARDPGRAAEQFFKP